MICVLVYCVCCVHTGAIDLPATATPHLLRLLPLLELHSRHPSPEIAEMAQELRVNIVGRDPSWTHRSAVVETAAPPEGMFMVFVMSVGFFSVWLFEIPVQESLHCTYPCPLLFPRCVCVCVQSTSKRLVLLRRAQ